MNDRTTEFLRKLEEFGTTVDAELAQVQEDLREIDVLIRQSTSEVERLAQRNAQIQNKVRQMEQDLASTPREDIRALYSAAQESQLRLFMMRSQVEQLQSRQRQLENYDQQLRQFKKLTHDLPFEDTEFAEFQPETEKAASSLSNSMITRIFDAQERERQHLARQMHDGPAQSLTNLILQAEICERLFESDPEGARAELGNLKTAVNATFQKVRGFIFDLRPMMLDDLGLVPTIKRYINTYQRKVDFEIALQVNGEERRLPDSMEIGLFRAMQELLQNVARHSDAHHVQVHLDLGDSGVSLSVEDDGKGFDVTEVLHASPHGAALPHDRQHQAGRGAVQGDTLGLPALRERVEILGGELHVESKAGRGTRAVVHVPTPEKE